MKKLVETFFIGFSVATVVSAIGIIATYESTLSCILFSISLLGAGVTGMLFALLVINEHSSLTMPYMD